MVIYPDYWVDKFIPYYLEIMGVDRPDRTCKCLRIYPAITTQYFPHRYPQLENHGISTFDPVGPYDRYKWSDMGPLQMAQNKWVTGVFHPT